jgi:ABC-type uncharacterized transport system auxiliary subunit
MQNIKRYFCQKTLALIGFLLIGCAGPKNVSGDNFEKQIKETLGSQVMKEAEWAMKQQPITVTATSSPRSAGGIHDFFSE